MNKNHQINPSRLALPSATIQTEDGIDHYNNPHPRCPVALLLDTSSSMQGRAIEELQSGLQAFFAALAKDELASLRIDLTCYTFGGFVQQVVPFGATVDGLASRPPRLTANGGTPLGEAVRTAISAINARRQVYRECALAAYRPWVVIMSDGQPNDPGWESAADQLHQFAQSGWNVLCIGLGGDQAQLAILQRFAVHPAKLLSQTDIGAFFAWLSDSLKTNSHSHTAANTCAGLPSVLPSIPKL